MSRTTSFHRSMRGELISVPVPVANIRSSGAANPSISRGCRYVMLLAPPNFITSFLHPTTLVFDDVTQVVHPLMAHLPRCSSPWLRSKLPSLAVPLASQTSRLLGTAASSCARSASASRSVQCDVASTMSTSPYGQSRTDARRSGLADEGGMKYELRGCGRTQDTEAVMATSPALLSNVTRRAVNPRKLHHCSRWACRPGTLRQGPFLTLP